MQQVNLLKGYAECEAIMKHHAKSYSFATAILPEEFHRPTYALYAFVRIPDDIVDSGKFTKEEMRVKLQEFENEFWQALDGKPSTDIFAAIGDTFKKFDFPRAWAESFLKAMWMDVDKVEYQTYRDLEEYMEGSAGVVGYFMASMVGLKSEEALRQARNLGFAFQLTNFFRDVEMDFHQLGRIYLPIEDLNQFGVSREDFRNRNFNDNFRRLMEFEMNRADLLYAQADEYLWAHKKQQGVKGFLVSSKLYHAIQDALKKQWSNPFAGRASTSLMQKFIMALQVQLKFWL